MLNIILSFDDSRDDFYSRAFPILKKYNIPSTLNVISSFVKGDVICDFPSSCNKAMTCEQIVECQQSGIVELACHGATHQNTREDIIRNISELKQMGCTVDNIGAASQGSEITIQNRNDDGIWDLVKNGTLSYLRSGIVVRREGYIYSALTLLDMFVHNKYLYYLLNKKCFIENPTEPFFLSAAIVNYTTVKQIKYFVDRFVCQNEYRDNSALILMFHSILKKDDPGYGKDKWYWDECYFDEICSFLHGNKKLRTITTQDYVLNCLKKNV